jgi:iron(III) transport system permease protein
MYAHGLRSKQLIGLMMCGLLGLFIISPVAYVLVNSFNIAGPGQTFRLGLSNWQHVFSVGQSLDSIATSLLLSLRIPAGIGVGFLVAWLLIRVPIPARTFIEYSLWFTFFLPTVPMTMAWVLLLDPNYGILNQFVRILPFVPASVFSIYSLAGITWVNMTLATVPIMVLLLTPAVRRLDAAYEEAAEMSGASLPTTLRRITFPLLAPAIITALIAGFIVSLQVFEIEQILGVPANIFVYSTRIYALVNDQPPDFPGAMALSSAILVLLIMLAVAYQLQRRRFADRPTLAGKGFRLRSGTRPKWAYAASIVLVLLLTAGTFLPLAVLVLGSFMKLFGFFAIKEPWTVDHWAEVLGDPAFGSAAINSLWIGLAAGTIGVALYAVIAWALARGHVQPEGALSLLTWLPWAIPGLLLGLAYFYLLSATPPLRVLTGTLVPLLTVLTVQYMPLGVQIIRSSILQIAPEMEEAAMMSGARLITTFTRVTAPLIAPMLLSVFVLVFMNSLTNISTTVFLITPSTRTLPLLMFEWAISNKFENATVVGVVIALLSLGTVVAIRLGARLSL